MNLIEEHRSATRLTRLLEPETIAIAGYSERSDAWSYKVYRSLARAGYPGSVLALRPRNAPENVRVIDSLADEPVDLLIVSLPASAVVDVVKEAADANVGSVLVLTAGFAESGEDGKQLQEDLVAAAGSMPVIGPNSVGLLNYKTGLHASASPFAERSQPEPAPVAVVAQSGAVGFTLIDQLNRCGAPAAYYVSAGNEAVENSCRIALNLLERDDVTVVGLYLESVRNPSALVELGDRASQLGKSVVALVSGTSDAGRRAAQSHTAAVVGDSLLLAGLLRDAEISVARDEEGWAAAVAIRATAGGRAPRRPQKLAVLTMSGGAGAVIADRMGDLGVAVPALDPVMVGRIRSEAPFVASEQNPIDVGGMFLRHLDNYESLLHLLDNSDDVDAVACYVTCGDHTPKEYKAIASSLARLQKPGWLIWSGAEPGALASAGHPGVVLPSIGSFARAIESLPLSTTSPAEGPAETTLTAESRDAIRSRLERDRGSPLRTETTLAEVFIDAGVDYAHLESWPAAQVYCDGLVTRFPAVAKLDSPQAPHRARLGLIQLDLQNPRDVETASIRLVRRARELEIDISNARVAIQEQREIDAMFALGAIRDPSFGSFLIVGPGGAKVEASSKLRKAFPLPLRARSFDALVRTVRELVDREIHRADLKRITETIEMILVAADDIIELDLNPVVVDKDSRLTLIDSLAIGKSEN